jgi:protein N-terminal asparagine amidohydrolase
VWQREFATAQPNKIDLLGSDEATTCFILILRSPRSWKASCGHFDGAPGQLGGKQCSLRTMVGTFDGAEQSYGLEAHVFGTYDSGHRESVTALRALLYLMHALPLRIHLVSVCVGALNTIVEPRTAVARPLVRGACVELRTGAVFPATWAYRGPDLAFRIVRSMCGPSQLVCVYDAALDAVVLAPVPYEPLPAAEVAQLEALSDEQLLAATSTSPLVESDGFVADMRAALRCMREMPDWRRAFGGGPRYYRRQPGTGEWVPCASPPRVPRLGAVAEAEGKGEEAEEEVVEDAQAAGAQT